MNLNLSGVLTFCCPWFKTFRASEVNIFLMEKERDRAKEEQVKPAAHW